MSMCNNSIKLDFILLDLYKNKKSHSIEHYSFSLLFSFVFIIRSKIVCLFFRSRRIVPAAP